MKPSMMKLPLRDGNPQLARTLKESLALNTQLIWRSVALVTAEPFDFTPPSNSCPRRSKASTLVSSRSTTAFGISSTTTPCSADSTNPTNELLGLPLSERSVRYVPGRFVSYVPGCSIRPHSSSSSRFSKPSFPQWISMLVVMHTHTPVLPTFTGSNSHF